MSIKIAELLPENANKELEEVMKKKFNDMMWETLIYLEIAFPHERGDGSREEKLFNTIRPKILRIGNEHIRDLEKIFNSYGILKVQEYTPIVRKDVKVDIYNFRNKFKVNKQGGKDNG